jgi:hypothetical protein
LRSTHSHARPCWHTTFFSLLTPLRAVSLGFDLFSQGASQKGVFSPFPIMIVVAALTSEQGWPHQSKYACGVGHESSLGRINLSIQFHGSTFSVWIETNELHRKHKFITTGNLTHTPHQIPRTGWHLFFFQNTHKICVSISLRLGINNFTRKMLWSCSHQDQPKTAYSYYMIPGWSVRRNSERWLVRGKIPNRTGPARNATDVPGHAGATNRRLFTSRVYIAVTFGEIQRSSRVQHTPILGKIKINIKKLKK